MATRDTQTREFDFFRLAGEEPLTGKWPDQGRFPTNNDTSRVEDTVLSDLKQTESALLITGFSTLDRIIDYVAGLDRCTSVRILLGSEPNPSRKETFEIMDRDEAFLESIKKHYLEEEISILYSAKLLLCIERLQSKSAQVRYSRRLHAKMYVSDRAATLGSSNFTDPGLRWQTEGNVRFRRHDDSTKQREKEEHCRFLEVSQIAENYWDNGKEYKNQLLDLLKQLLRFVSWEEAVARASAELLEGDWVQPYFDTLPFGDRIELWPFQRQGIAQALYILAERESVLIADPTGAGKTRLCVHLLGALIQDMIRRGRTHTGRVAVITPPLVVNEWNNEAVVARVPLTAYSHGGLSQQDRTLDSNLFNDTRRASVLCVDEVHNFFNPKAARTRRMLSNTADYKVLLTATPINKSARDMRRIADILGADNLDDSTNKAIRQIASMRNVPGQPNENLEAIRNELEKFTVRRTKRHINYMVDQNLEAYERPGGGPYRYPQQHPEIYSLHESEDDREKARKIKEWSSGLIGIHWVQKKIERTSYQKRLKISEEECLKMRLHNASVNAQYRVAEALRSSRPALLKHLCGTEQATTFVKMTGFEDKTRAEKNAGNIMGALEKDSDKPPGHSFETSTAIAELPRWVTSAEEHVKATEHDLGIYRKIVECVRSMSDRREREKANLLVKLMHRHSHVLAFDSHPITLAYIQMLLQKVRPRINVFMATGRDTSKTKKEFLHTFSPKNDDDKTAIGLCSDIFSEGVNLQRAQAMVHLDRPTVMRFAEQRAGRIDRMNSPHSDVYAWWPSDAPEFRLSSDYLLRLRHDTTKVLIGSNMLMPDDYVFRSAETEDAIREFHDKTDEWDGREDAFSSVRALVSGSDALISEQIYKEYVNSKDTVYCRVCLVEAERPWAVFCLHDWNRIPRWIALRSLDEPMETDLRLISELLRVRLGAGVKNLSVRSTHAQDVLNEFVHKAAGADRKLLSIRKRRALSEMEIVVEKFRDDAWQRGDEAVATPLTRLLEQFQQPSLNSQPRWIWLADQWLDMINPIWNEKLAERRRRKPLQMKDIREDLFAAEKKLLPALLSAMRKCPPQKPIDRRIVACILGVDPR